MPPDGLSLVFTEKADFFPVLADLITQGEFRFVSPVKTKISAYILSNETIEITGNITTLLRLECGRCLEPFEHPLTHSFLLGFVKHTHSDASIPDDDNEIEVREEDISTEYYVGDVIELKNIIQEQVVISLPQKALCSESCKGLCQNCGTNLNHSACTCMQINCHPAFAALKSLKK